MRQGQAHTSLFGDSPAKENGKGPGKVLGEPADCDVGLILAREVGGMSVRGPCSSRKSDKASEPRGSL